MRRTLAPEAREYLLREHQRLFHEYQHLRREYECLPAADGESAARRTLIRKVRQFSQMLANHRLAFRYKRDGLI